MSRRGKGGTAVKLNLLPRKYLDLKRQFHYHLMEVMEEAMMIRYLEKLKAYQDIQLSASTYENMVSCLSNLTEPPLVADLGELYLATQGKASSAAGRGEGRGERRAEGDDALVDWKGFVAGELGLSGQTGRAFKSIQNKVRLGRFSTPCVTEFFYKGLLLLFTYVHIMRIASPACGVNLMQALIAGPIGRAEGDDALVDWKGFMDGELGLNGG